MAKSKQRPPRTVSGSAEPETAVPASGVFVERVDALARTLAVSVDDAARGYYAGQLGPERAARLGARHESGVVLDAFLAGVQGVITEVAQGSLAEHGYGPLRLAAALEVARSLAGEIGAIDAALVAAAGAAGHADVSLRNARTVRAQALAVLRNTTAPDDAEGQRRVREARRADRSANDRARSLAAIAQEVERRLGAIPPSVARDSGVTPELVAALRAHVAAIDASRGGRVDARGTALSRYEVMDLLDGRLLHELRAMLAAWRALRTKRPGLPQLRASVLNNGRRAKKTAADPAPEPVPAPAPAKPVA